MPQNDLVKLIDDLCDEFEDEIRGEKSPPIVDYLDRVPETARAGLFKELIALEMELSDDTLWAQRSSQYENEFPEYSDVLRQSKDPSFVKSVRRPVASLDPVRERQIGPYRLLQQIGEGGMGIVWMAEQEKPVRRRVAVKVIRSDIGSKEAISRFEAERQALAMMDHRNIAKVLDAGTTDTGNPYFVMELVKGIPITEYCDANRLNIRERLDLFIPVCKAIQHAHQKGIIHRDIKPSNVLVTLSDGKPEPKVIDFGLAKALEQSTKLTDKTMFTEFGKVVGTLQYMSPEQAEMNAMDVDTRTDIYSLGVMLYELLTGSTPLEQDTIGKNALLQVLNIIRENEPPRPSIRFSSSFDAASGISEQRRIAPARLKQILRGELDWVVMKALEKDRSRRYETANDLAQDIGNYLSDEPVVARPPTPGYRLWKSFRRHRRLVVSVSFVLVTLVLGVSLAIWGVVQSETLRKELSRNNEKLNRTVETLRLTNEKLESTNKREKKAKEEAVLARQVAEKEEKTAEGVLGFFENDFLRVANPWDIYQIKSIKSQKSITINEVLDRAAEKFQPENYAQSELTPTAYLKILLTIADVYEGLGESGKAVKFAEGAFAIASQEFGDNAPVTLDALINLAFVKLADSKPAEGVGMFIDTYFLIKAMVDKAATRDKLDPVHRDVEIALQATVDAIKRRMDFSRYSLPQLDSGFIMSSIKIQGRLLVAGLSYPGFCESIEKQYGAENEMTLYAKCILAMVAYAQGNLKNARSIFEQLLGVLEAKVKRDELSPDDIALMGARQVLAKIYDELGVESKARTDLARMVYESMRRRFGASHPGTTISMCFYANYLEAFGKFDAAEKYYDMATEIYDRRLEPTSRVAVDSLVNKSRNIWKQKKYELAFRAMMNRLKLLEGNTSTAYAKQSLLLGIEELGQACILAGQYDEAASYLQTAYSVRRRLFPQLWPIFRVQSLWGWAQFKAGDVKPAKENLEGGYAGLVEKRKAIPRSKKEVTKKALDRLVEFSKSINDSEAEAKWSKLREQLN